MTVRPYGSWPSPITSELLVQQVVSLGQVAVSGDDLYWVEGRPAERGRQALVRWRPGAEAADVLPEDFSARTTVHEYGGGAFCVAADMVWFSNFADQRLWRFQPGGPPQPVTPEGPDRYADGTVAVDGTWLACVRERHGDDGVVNEVVVVPADGSSPPTVVASGHDFYAAPRIGPDGRLAWLCWDHPRMPWDGTELEVDGERVAGGADESLSQPRWGPDGSLWWMSDRTGWWNLYRDGEPVAPMEAECAGPDWVFGLSTWALLPDGRAVVACASHGTSRLTVVGANRSLDLPFTSFESVRAYGRGVACVAASPTKEPAVVTIDVDTSEHSVVRRSRQLDLDPAWVSEPEAVEFPTGEGHTAHALFYRPKSPEAEGPPGELPPLVVTSHGGPTAAASSALNLRTQFWTTRGIAVVDVDYRGSTGYGREYRRLLAGQWGVADVDDCIAGARYLGAVPVIDRDKTIIRGSSASGMTALLALTRGVFAAGASLYGVADLEALATDTHKFESRYLDGLIGPWPEARDTYRERSPLHQADRLAAPLIIFQGADDKVVPPAQAEVLVAALRRAGLPFAYLLFEGESHGFRQAATLRRVSEAELYFYGQVLGFDPADDLEPVEIENRDQLPPGRQ